MAKGDATTLEPVVETSTTDRHDQAGPSEKPIQDEPMEATQSIPLEMEARQSEPMEVEARQSEPMEMEARKSTESAGRQSAASIELERMSKRQSTASVSSVPKVREMKSVSCSTFQIPALIGRPHAGKATLRTRPVLNTCDPQKHKHFTLTIYAMLSVQVAVVALVTAAVTASILSGWLPGLLPTEIAPSPTTPVWMPGYPFNVAIAVFPAWFCMVFSFVALSFFRGLQKTCLFFFVACNLTTGIFLGLLTYFESSFATLCICIVLMSLVIHTVGISVNLISCLALSFGQVKPKASKMEMMGRTSYLTGTEKFICLLYDEDAAYTRASVALAGLSWLAATITAACVVAFLDMNWVPWLFAAGSAAFFLTYFTYGVEKQVRRCKPKEKASAMINLTIDLLFFVGEVLTIDLSVLEWQELGSAQPDPVARGSFQYVMKQLSSGTTQSTTVSSSLSKTTPRVTVAV